MQEDILTVSGLNVEFDNHIVLDDISFAVKRDSTMAIIGPNGAGKSVLFRSLLNLIPYKGTISWSEDTRIGYVPQKLAVDKELPLTVYEFLSFKEKSRDKVLEVMGAVGFLKEANHIHNDTRVL
ncbi:MAG: ATP-binding cassette domain-containing protein, partial [Pirellulaceae bacterium]